MRVLIINQHFSDVTGGSEYQCHILAEGLYRKNVKVLYAAAGPFRKEKYHENYQVVPVDLSEEKPTKELIYSFKPDCIYWRFNKHHLSRVRTIAIDLNIPFIFAGSHINDFRRYAYKPSVWKGWRALKRYIRSCYTQISYSSKQFPYVLSSDIITSNNGELIEGINHPYKRTIYNGQAPVVGKFDWHRKYCLWVSNLKASKRPEQVIKLAIQLKDIYPEVDFLLMGNIQDPHYESLIREWEKYNNIHYLGYQDQETINAALKSAELLIHTSEPEGFPNILIQAWFMGCATATLNYDPDSFIKKHPVLGKCCKNQRDMFRYVSHVLSRKNKAYKNHKDIKVIAEQNFSIDRFIDNVYQIISGLVKEEVKVQ